MGPIDPFPVHCDMETAGGGWTMVLRVDGAKNTFNYGDPLWTNTDLLNPGDAALHRVEAKLGSWATVKFTEVMVGMEYPILMDPAPMSLKHVEFAATGDSLYALISPGTYIASKIGRDVWKSLITGGSLQANCNREGLNVASPGGDWHGVRIGIVANNENDCTSPDSRIGIGGVGTACSTLNSPAGNFAGCGGDDGDKNLIGFGVVYVR
ncbi:MAG: hypothetical protein H6710_06910 [Myxococcales bacterium]|nr:hypothetical protein [Myxococcales bacterium]